MNELTKKDILIATNIAKHVKKINFDFGMNIDDDNYDWIEDFLSNIKEMFNCEIYSGVTKVVIVPREHDFVIKIPYEGGYIWENHDDEDDSEEVFYSFEFAKSEFGWNYCEEELRIYDIANEKGWNWLFPDTRFLGNFNDRPMYIQKKIYCTSNQSNLRKYSKSFKRISDNSKNVIKNFKENRQYRIGEYEWNCRVIDYYGLDKTAEIKKILNELEISDLHGGNIGYTKDLRPIILDWGGFHEEF